MRVKAYLRENYSLEKRCQLLAPFCGLKDCKDEIKELSKRDENLKPVAPSIKAKSLCIPFDHPAETQNGDKCIKPGCCRKP